MGSAPADVKSIFGKAMDLESPAECALYLDEACAADPHWRAEVESLPALGAGLLTPPPRPTEGLTRLRRRNGADRKHALGRDRLTPPRGWTEGLPCHHG
jgi:hypothetical protein